MNDPRHDPSNSRPRKDAIDRSIDADLEALRRLTVQDLPTLEQTARGARAARTSREGFMNRSIRALVARPWLATAAGVAALALLLLAIPFSYSRTTGYEVRLHVAPPASEAAALPDLADRMKEAFHVDRVTITTDRGVTLSARLPLGSRPRIQQGLATLAPAIAALGPSVRTEIDPVVERVSGTVYAMATQRIVNLHIDREGKSLAEIETELRDQLAAAGLPGADVKVTQDGDQMQMQMLWQCAPGDSSICPVDVNITMDGLPQGERKVIKLTPDHPLSDIELKQEIERQLRDQGMRNPSVEVRDGKVVSVSHD